jgi:hypothetical protein
MYKQISKMKLYWIAPLSLVVASFVFFTSQAEAKIVVEGDRQFTDDVNQCLITYGNATGIVGDVIKELGNSSKEHKILNSPDWNNTSNDVDQATGGAGSGTVTRVDKAELEKYKTTFPELKNKDFCTALLHELWHAVDANRGTRTSHDDKVDGVKRNEVEATIFQNLIHAIRGVAPRTAYGGVEISLLQPAAVSTTASMRFAHVSPGVYSEVYATISTAPGAIVNATLSGPGVSGTASQSKTAGNDGVVSFTWRIVSFGTYTMNATSNGTPFSSTVSVN